MQPDKHIEVEYKFQDQIRKPIHRPSIFEPPKPNRHERRKQQALDKRNVKAAQRPVEYVVADEAPTMAPGRKRVHLPRKK